jgi:hypothetical protein
LCPWYITRYGTTSAFDESASNQEEEEQEGDESKGMFIIGEQTCWGRLRLNLNSAPVDQR